MGKLNIENIGGYIHVDGLPVFGPQETRFAPDFSRTARELGLQLRLIADTDIGLDFDQVFSLPIARGETWYPARLLPQRSQYWTLSGPKEGITQFNHRVHLLLSEDNNRDWQTWYRQIDTIRRLIPDDLNLQIPFVDYTETVARIPVPTTPALDLRLALAGLTPKSVPRNEDYLHYCQRVFSLREAFGSIGDDQENS